ncbi:hypothetical protein DPMN_006287 [Dreissena polymorpha]|uniref:Uncharacterized protein n=1 Tax=Dreissena polymorpha TaxID=45954 RepID=A0A9D4MR71_DREPO|nr:hypothetical protein DPMN_006287 [Dreissena polymorpha]
MKLAQWFSRRRCLQIVYRRTDGRRTLSDHNSSPRAIAQEGDRGYNAQNIIGTNLLTKFHKDRKINVLTRKNAPPPGSHVFQPTGSIL